MGLERAETVPARPAAARPPCGFCISTGFLFDGVAALRRTTGLPYSPYSTGWPWSTMTKRRTESTRISTLAGWTAPGCPVRPDT